ncbi:MAG: AMP-binding protein [Blastocatellia bacterium AA13]|nr:MAG: AMP-binding protein [Blastocatellia bacterium AA13]
MAAGEDKQRPASYRDVTVGDLLELLARDYPENEALIYPDIPLRHTFSQLEWVARRLAKGLTAYGVKNGDRVALWAPNVPEWVPLQFALAKIGAILVTVNTSLCEQELDYLLKQSETGTLITVRGFRDNDYIGAINRILPELASADGELNSARLPFLKRVIYIGGDDSPAGTIRYDSLLSASDQVSDRQLDEVARQVQVDDVINMQYTSGTTGFPKGVMLSSRNIVNNGYWLGEGLGYTERDRVCVPVPFFHCFGCVIGVLGAYTHAAAIVPLECYDPLKVLQHVEKERCTSLYGVPTMFLGELEQLDYHSFDLSSLRTGVMAGALCPEPLMRRVMDKMRLNELTIAYGLTEASPGITQTPRTDSVELRTQTVGQVLPEVEVRIVNPLTGERCADDESGELCCRGYNVMRGYYNNPKATFEAIDNEGWLHTGDQASLDAEGYVRITGRIKDLIIRGGENIAPKEIEDLLRLHPGISDVYVYGIPDDKYGEDVAAAIRLNPGEALSADEIREFCRDRIARFKIPRQIRFVDSFPMTASGKVQKFKLREMHTRNEPA